MEVFLGSIVAFGFNFPPYGWASCSGQTLSIAENTALYSLMGTTYGGNGQTTFGVPNLQGRAPIGQGNFMGTIYTMGETAGNDEITLTIGNMPAHNHLGQSQVAIPANTADGNSTNPEGNILAASGSVHNMYSTGASDAAMANITTSTVTVGITGSNQPFDITDPYLAINYSIALEGIFPSRN